MLPFCHLEEINCKEDNLNHLYLTVKQKKLLPAGPQQQQNGSF